LQIIIYTACVQRLNSSSILEIHLKQKDQFTGKRLWNKLGKCIFCGKEKYGATKPMDEDI
jgi:hypothetical protein